MRIKSRVSEDDFLAGNRNQEGGERGRGDKRSPVPRASGGILP